VKYAFVWHFMLDSKDLSGDPRMLEKISREVRIGEVITSAICGVNILVYFQKAKGVARQVSKDGDFAYDGRGAWSEE
jgi:hypothetical protein